MIEILVFTSIAFMAFVCIIGYVLGKHRELSLMLFATLVMAAAVYMKFYMF